MKHCTTVILLSCMVLACVGPARAASAKVNPADYPLAVHISASTYATTANTLFEIVTATIDGKHYQLQGPTSSARAFSRGNGLIDPGDYHAKLTTDEHKTSYESAQQFEILFPDGSTRKFGVIGQWE